MALSTTQPSMSNPRSSSTCTVCSYSLWQLNISGGESISFLITPNTFGRSVYPSSIKSLFHKGWLCSPKGNHYRLENHPICMHAKSGDFERCIIPQLGFYSLDQHWKQGVVSQTWRQGLLKSHVKMLLEIVWTLIGWLTAIVIVSFWLSTIDCY